MDVEDGGGKWLSARVRPKACVSDLRVPGRGTLTPNPEVTKYGNPARLRLSPLDASSFLKHRQRRPSRLRQRWLPQQRLSNQK